MNNSPPPPPALRILHIIATVDPRGGGPIEGILRQDESVSGTGRREIVSLDPPDAPFLANFPIPVYPLGLGHFNPRTLSNHFIRFGYTPKFIPWLLANYSRYDCIIVNGLWHYGSVGASLALIGRPIPYFVFSHGMMSPWFRHQNILKHYLKQIFWLLFDGRLLRHATAVFFTSEEELRLARGEFWGHTYRGTVIQYGAADVTGTPAEQIREFRAALPALGDRPFLLFMGRIHKVKGCDILVRAFAKVAKQHPGLALVIAGPDQTEWVPRLTSMAATLGVGDEIYWPGMLRGEAKWGALRAAVAFVLPSHQENFGVVVAEALACGTPVLITDKVNIWREIEADGAGLVEADTEDGIVSLIEQFLSLPADAVNLMRLNARQCFERHFNMKTAAFALLMEIKRHLDG